MYRKILILLITLVAASCIQAQDIQIPDGQSARWVNEKLADQIFNGEQMTIAQVSKRAPMVETYIQSLDPEKTPEGLIDDAYFLGRTMLDPDSGQRSRLQLLTPEKKNGAPQIRVNTGDHWSLHPAGYVEMLFVDVADFDIDHYSLRYAGTESLGEKMFLRVEVRPLDAKESGRFLGDIWVDSKSLRIARIAGTFSPKRLGFASKYLNASGISQLGLYFHFESWRQEVSPGIWMPSYTYFDEQRSAGSGNLVTGFHLRGHVWTWGYQRTEIARASTKLPTSRAELEESGILASPGQVELVLNGIVEELEKANGISRSIGCRVLLTSPAQIFSIDDTVFVSRGLLNLVPNQSVLVALIAREIGQILSGDSHAQRGAPGMPAEAEPAAESLSIRIRRFEHADANERMRLLLKYTQYASAVDELESFFASLVLYSPRVPHLMEPLSGGKLLGQSTMPPGIAQSVPAHLDTSKAQNLELRGEYGVDSWESQVVSLASQDSPRNSVAEATESTRSRVRPGKRN